MNNPKPKFSVYRLNEITAIIMDEIGRDEKKTEIEKGKMFCKIRRAIGKIANADWTLHTATTKPMPDLEIVVGFWGTTNNQLWQTIPKDK